MKIDLQFSKIYLQIFILLSLITIFVILYFNDNLIIILLLITLTFYHTFKIVKKSINTKNNITLNQKNILINGQKIENIKLKFSNNIWTIIEYNFKKQQQQQLIIFNDSCKKHTLYQINKNLKLYLHYS